MNQNGILGRNHGYLTIILYILLVIIITGSFSY